MAFLGLDLLLALVRDPETLLVDGLDERELSAPEGSGFDLRIARLFILKGHGELTDTHRKTPEFETVSSDVGAVVDIEPQRYYVLQTMERVNFPEGYVGIVRPRSTLYRSGIILTSGQVNPGYRGQLFFGLVNLHTQPFRLAVGARVAHMLVASVAGNTNPYQGQWQSGRPSAPSLELQI